MTRTSPLIQLFLLRVRAFLREPGALFWVLCFPLLVTVALGVAFRSVGPGSLEVAVVGGPEVAALVQRLDAVEGLRAHAASLSVGRDELRRGRVAVVLLPGSHPQLWTDPLQPDSRPARLMVSDALERLAGRRDPIAIEEQKVSAPGSRYIDFLLPGLIGYSLLTTGMFGFGFALVQMRTDKLLKRLGSTPMKRSDFLLAFVLSRGLLALVEITVLVLFGWLVFGVRVYGSVFSLYAWGLAGALSFAGLVLLVTSRAQNYETANGLANAFSIPMMALSGVFFSSSHFPQWSQPLIRALPLTALNEGMRAIMIDGTPLPALWPQAAILVAWGAGAYLLSLRLYRWS